MTDFHDDPLLLVAAKSPLIAESCPWRPYDEVGQSTLFAPNGTKVCSFDRGFLNAATAEIIRQWRAE